MVTKINADLFDPNFNYEGCIKNSKACASLYVWIWNMAKVRSLILGIPVATKQEKIEVTLAWYAAKPVLDINHIPELRVWVRDSGKIFSFLWYCYHRIHQLQ